LLLGLSGALALSACANKYDSLTPEIQAKMMDDLKQGNLVLDCGAKCSFTWIAKVQQIHQFDTAERWQDLAQAVMQIGYGQDLSYYYLGQAAQGLGYQDAAIKYYRYSFSLNTGQDPLSKCASLASQTNDPCQGVDIAASIPVLIKASEDVLAQQAAAAAAAEAPAPKPKRRHKTTQTAAPAAAPSTGGSSGSSGFDLPPPPPATQ
jgi:hypothetical protein